MVFYTKVGTTNMPIFGIYLIIPPAGGAKKLA
jgi:hypothetical protein